LFEKLFGKNKKENDDITKTEIEVTDNINESEEDDEELIAVIAAAVSAVLRKPVSGFRVVSFKKREGWKLI